MEVSMNDDVDVTRLNAESSQLNSDIVLIVRDRRETSAVLLLYRYYVFGLSGSGIDENSVVTPLDVPSWCRNHRPSDDRTVGALDVLRPSVRPNLTSRHLWMKSGVHQTHTRHTLNPAGIEPPNSQFTHRASLQLVFLSWRSSSLRVRPVDTAGWTAP